MRCGLVGEVTRDGIWRRDVPVGRVYRWELIGYLISIDSTIESNNIDGLIWQATGESEF